MTTRNAITDQKLKIEDIAQFLTDELGVYVEPMLVVDALQHHNYVLTDYTADFYFPGRR